MAGRRNDHSLGAGRGRHRRSLTLDDPNQSANTMNARLRGIDGRHGRAPARPRRTQITGVVITSAKKTFFAGGDLNDLKPRDQRRRARARRDGARRASASCAAWRRWACRSSPRSTAPRSAAAWRSPGLPPPHRGRRPEGPDGLPEVQLGLLPGAGGVVRTVRMLGIVDALMKLLMQGQRLRPRKAMEVGIVDEVVATRGGARPRRQGWIAGQAAEDGRAAVGRRRATRSPAARRRTRSSRRTCRRSRRTCASSSRAPTTRRRSTSCPRPSRARRSTSTPRSRSRAVTSSTCSPARSPRT